MLFRIDFRYFAKGGIWLTSGQVVLSGMALINAIAFANLLPAEVFGQYRFILSIIGILGLTTLVGMDTAFLRAASRGLENTLHAVLKRRILFGLLGSAGALIGTLYYVMHNNMLLAGALALGALFIPLKDPFRIYNTLLQARRHFGTITLYRIVAQGVSLTSLVITMMLSDTLNLILLAYFLPVTLIELYLLRYTLHKQPLVGGTDQQALRYGYHLSFLRSISGLAGHMHNIMLFHFLGPISVALFYFAIAPIEQARALIGNIETLLFPKTAQDSWHIGTFRVFARKVAPFLFIISLGVITYIVLTPILFAIVFPSYNEAVFFSQLYAPTIIFTALNVVLFTIVKSKGSVKTQYIVSGIDTILQLTLTILFIFLYGILGLIVAIAITKAIQTTLLMGRLFVYPRLYLKHRT